MTKKEIVRRVSAEFSIDQTLTRKIIQRYMDLLIEVLTQEHRIELRNFGVFEVRQRAARKARNPKTNQEVLVPPKRVITFQAGKNVSQLLQRPAPGGTQH